ncbi:MAG: hypothetical protein HKN23_15600, partial [Verrucomicrobiales bacterium]|nr:hypothetical protein [Verrucomicrobiales bacterium]
ERTIEADWIDRFAGKLAGGGDVQSFPGVDENLEQQARKLETERYSDPEWLNRQP